MNSFPFSCWAVQTAINENGKIVHRRLITKLLNQYVVCISHIDINLE